MTITVRDFLNLFAAYLDEQVQKLDSETIFWSELESCSNA